MPRVAMMLPIVCVGFCFVVGCATGTSGNQQLQTDRVSQIKKGQTTRAEVEAMFGSPQNVSVWPDGRRVMMYMGMQSQNDMSGMVTQSIVPFAAFAPGTDTHKFRRQQLQIYLNSDNIVQDYEFSDNTTETKTTHSVFGAHSEQTTVPNSPPDNSSK